MVEEPPSPSPARRILETSLYGPDLDRMHAFYERVMGLETISRFGRRGTALRCGDGVLLLFDPDASARGDGDVPPHGARGPGHVAFFVSPDELPGWRTHLAACDVEIETEVEWENGHSIYFRDPAGNSVELASPSIWGLDPEA